MTEEETTWWEEGGDDDTTDSHSNYYSLLLESDMNDEGRGGGNEGQEVEGTGRFVVGEESKRRQTYHCTCWENG